MSKKHLFLTLLFFTSLWLIPQVQVEYLWLKQFNYEFIIFKKWAIQFLLITFGLFIIYINRFWINKWILTDYKIKKKEITYLSPIGYSIRLICTSILFCLLNILYFNLFCTSILNPEALSYSLFDLSFNRVFFGSLSLLLISAFSFRFNKRLTLYRYNFVYSLILIYILIRAWSLWTLAFAIPDTGIIESLFNTDISYGLARFPALSFAILLLFIYFFLTLSSIYLLYLIGDGRLSDWKAPVLTTSEKNNLRPISSIITFLASVLMWLSRHQFLWKTNGMIEGASWLNVHFEIPIRVFISFNLFLFSLIIITKIPFKIKKIIRKILISLSFIGLALEIIVSPILQWIIVKPRELSLETPYILKSIQSTRKAFQLDSIKTKLYKPQESITKEDLILATNTLKNIRLWDTQPLLATNRQLQQLRVYYKFVNASVDRYRLNDESNEPQQVIVSAREIDQSALPLNSRTWLNKHFVFTHGYGFTVSPVNTKAKNNLPEYFISDLGFSTKIQGNRFLGISDTHVKNKIPIKRAAIYFGNLDIPYAVVPSKLEELDYPQGDQNVFNHYQGNGGISIGNIWNRILMSLYLKEPRILTTGSVNNDSRILLKRDIKQRVKSIAPFIEFRGEPYLISVPINTNNKYHQSNQNQYWIVEGYTTSKTYPYATRLRSYDNIRYIRNSVKAVVDAYNGTVVFYITEKNDPIIKGWSRVFPNLFNPINEMPNAVKEHLKVPTELFEIQVQQLLRFHVEDPRTFYSGDDVWEVPKELYGKELIAVAPYHIIAQLDLNKKSEFLLLQPLSPLARPNLAAWLAARNDGDNYGELVLIRFPGQTTIYGPEQIQALINQDPEISQQFSLWDRAGSEVIQGNLLVLPLGRSLLYVEPVYLKASKGGLPTLTRIVLSDGKKIVMSEDLVTGLNILLKKYKED